MDSVTANVLLIFTIFSIGLTLCFTQSVVAGIAFILTGNLFLPLLVEIPKMKKANAISKP